MLNAKRSVHVGALALAGSLAAVVPAQANVLFDFTFDPSLSAFGANLLALKAATQDVANEYGALYTNNVTVNIDVKADSDPNGLGSSLFENTGTSAFTYAQVRAALISHASTAPSISATSLLPLIDPSGGGQFIVPNAEAKALGLLAGNSTLLDGTFFIGTANTYTFNPNNRAVPGAFDYLGTAEHEFSEIMGRTTQLNNPGFGFLPFDLFRCTTSGRTLDPAATGVFFSTDGCATDAKDYNPPGNGGDIQDWATSTPPDSFDAFGAPGEAEPMSPIDQIVMNTLGWQSLTTNIPEPWTLALLLPGLVGILGLRRRAAA